MTCCRGFLGVSCRGHVSNAELRNRVTGAVGPLGDLLATVKGRRLRWCMSRGRPGLPRRSCREQCEETEEGEGGEGDRRIASPNRQERRWVTARGG